MMNLVTSARGLGIHPNATRRITAGNVETSGMIIACLEAVVPPLRCLTIHISVGTFLEGNMISGSTVRLPKSFPRKAEQEQGRGCGLFRARQPSIVRAAASSKDKVPIRLLGLFSAHHFFGSLRPYHEQCIKRHASRCSVSFACCMQHRKESSNVNVHCILPSPVICNCAHAGQDRPCKRQTDQLYRPFSQLVTGSKFKGDSF